MGKALGTFVAFPLKSVESCNTMRSKRNSQTFSKEKQVGLLVKGWKSEA